MLSYKDKVRHYTYNDTIKYILYSKGLKYMNEVYEILKV